MSKVLFLLVILFACATISRAQLPIIRGQVVDKTNGSALPFANVFVNQTTIGTAADENGSFQLEVPFGSIELIISHVGFRSHILKQNMESSVDLGTIALESDNVQLDDIVVKDNRDKEWERNIKKFESALIGTYGIARFCKIINPWILDFEEEGKELMVTARGPVKIRNDFLGYELWIYLNKSSLNNIGYAIHANVYFTELRTSKSEEAYHWATNRLKSYHQSSRYLFKSIIKNQCRGNGFHLYTDNPGGNQANTYLEATDNFRKSLGNTIIPYDTVGMFSKESNGLYKVVINGRMEIHYHNARALIRAYEDIGFPVSWMATKRGFLVVNENGVVLNPENLITSGDMIENWLGRLLPQDYNPQESSQEALIDPDLESYREHIYVHTDKPYYHQGEAVWFKAYVNYFKHQLRDSLSRVLYVDLISPDLKILDSKLLPINDGFSFGDFIIPDSLDRGVYFLRAYTHLQRNFGEGGLYTKSIPVLKLTDKFEGAEQEMISVEHPFMSLTSDKKIYSTRDMITIEISTFDQSGLPIAAHLSVSITDAKQVAKVNEQAITDEYPFPQEESPYPKGLKYPVEHGISITGQVENTKSRNMSATINMVDWASRDMYQIDTEKDGTFRVTGLDFFGTREFIFESRNERGKPFGKVKLQPFDKPEVFVETQALPWPVLETQNPQRIISGYEVPSGARLLDEVVIKDGKINMPQYKSTYGRPDMVLEQKDINLAYPNIMYSLYKIVPDGKILRSNQLSVLNPASMLVTIDDVPMVGDPTDVLSLIDPATVERVEITTRLNVLYGSQGVGGVIAVYLKKGADTPYEPRAYAQSYSIRGFDRSRMFISPDYTSVNSEHQVADYRSTLYWNPLIVTNPETGKTSFSFFAADLETTYRVVVEGVTAENEPLRCEYFIEVRN